MMGTQNNPGLIPRICEELFARMRVGQESGTGYRTHASYLEIYNERVKDLLAAQSTGHGLRVREHRSLGPYVENLSQHAVSDFDEIQVSYWPFGHLRIWYSFLEITYRNASPGEMRNAPRPAPT